MPNETNVFSSPSAPLALGVQSKPLGVISLLNPSGEVARRWRLQQPKCTIGSDRQATIWIDDPALSSFHALLVFGATQTIVKCFSTGVRLNGNPIREASLHVHDRLEIGTLTFLVEALPGSGPSKIVTSEATSGARAVDTAQLSSNSAINNPTSTQSHAPNAAASATVVGGSVVTSGSAKLEGQVETLLQRLSDIDSKISSTSAAQKHDFMLQCDSLRSESKQLRQVLTEDLVQHIKKLSEDLDRRLETRDAQSNSRLNQIASEFQRFQSTIETRLEQLQSRSDSQVQSLQTNLGDLAAIVETQQPFDIQDLERRLNILEAAIHELRTAVESREQTPLSVPNSALPKPLTEPFRSDGTHPHPSRDPSRGAYGSISANPAETTDRDNSISPASNSYAAAFHANVDTEDEGMTSPINGESSSFAHRSHSDYQEYAPILEPLKDGSDVAPMDGEDFDTPPSLPSWFTDTTDSDPSNSAHPSSIRDHADYGAHTTDSLVVDSEEANSEMPSDPWGDGLEEDIFADGTQDHFSDTLLYGSATDEIQEQTTFPSVSALDILRASYAQSGEIEEDEAYDADPSSNSLLTSKQQNSDRSTPSPEAMRSSISSKLSAAGQESENTSPKENDPANSASALLERLKREMVEQEEQEQAANPPAKSSNSLRSPKDKSLHGGSESSYGSSLSKPGSQSSSHSNASPGNTSQSNSSNSHPGGSEPGADDDSVEAYMQKLLARMRGDSAEESKEATNSAASPKTISTKSSLGKSTTQTNKVVRTTYSPMRKSRQDPAAALIASRPQVDATAEGTPAVEGAVADPNASTEPQEGEAMDTSSPRAAPEKSTDFRALRELANDSARTAIKSSESKVRPVGNIIKLSISVLASLFGIQLLYENGLQVNLTLVAAATAFMLAAIWCMDVIQSTKAAKKSEKKNGPSSQVQMKISGKR
jgi:pSer/pThr/pTyr-binding forkhead associated (FHA) protein